MCVLLFAAKQMIGLFTRFAKSEYENDQPDKHKKSKRKHHLTAKKRSTQLVVLRDVQQIVMLYSIQSFANFIW